MLSKSAAILCLPVFQPLSSLSQVSQPLNNNLGKTTHSLPAFQFVSHLLFPKSLSSKSYNSYRFKRTIIQPANAIQPLTSFFSRAT